MRNGHPSTVEQARARLLDLWQGDTAFGRPLGCVATTYTFDAELFEEQCLARFLSIQSNPNESTKDYIIEREEKLSQCFACVLVDVTHAAANRSLRWHQLPVTVPGGGVLHAKLTILAWEHCVRVLISSANITEPAYRRNQEAMTILDFNDQATLSPELLLRCVNFLNEVRRFAPGFDRTQTGPQAALATFLSSIQQRARSLPPAGSQDAECVLLPLIRNGENVIDQLRTLWTGPRPDRAWVLSPFFDEGEKASETAVTFSGLLTNRGERWLHIAAPGRILPDGTQQIDAPASLKQSSHPSLAHYFSIINQRVQIQGREQDRPLHAKSLWLERDGRALYALGSSNFTQAGLGLHPLHNIELNVAYLIKNCGSRFGRLCAHSWPADEHLDDLDRVQFLDDGPSDSGESDIARLPVAFGLALFALNESDARLELEFGADAPAVFDVLSGEGYSVIDASSWIRDGKPKKVVIPWEPKRPPTSLKVRWFNEQNIELSAPWIVNVLDTSVLPPPAELGNLSLAELIEVLSSARPVHEIVKRIRQRKETKPSPNEPEIDPHKKVDTSQFLLRRMRKVAQALEGMRDRLRQPLASTDGLRWRLRGPIGPISLAKRLAQEDPAGAAFMISEVAATLRGVEWPRGQLRAKEIAAEVDGILRELQELATSISSPPSLADYVELTFKELRT
ncbi:hypothetical protein JQ594_28550 [Bradyrhizobium manausense]|uniref:hypothetical protein n=1 Tax=Bradyrhizobium manausense TaxID=989370 RepID=UPI001BAB1478|nr:hypothetical protein [Bradyrhizobium manausense]MBR0689891.1 hypothetical protein [Bradyrhizobium manausense]